jgi:HD-GYP domain-containing protein (c-di-GMP phosphodiesterase class II)
MGEAAMTETQTLLGKITALRQRLTQAQNLAGEARAAAAALAGEEDNPALHLAVLERQATEGSEHDAALDRVVRPLARETRSGGSDGPPPAGPRKLTARARRVIERARNLLGQLRGLADAFEDPAGAGEAPVLLSRDEPLSRLYRETVALTDTALRTVPLLPDSTAAQMHLCEGLEAICNVVAGRLRALAGGVGRHRREADLLSRLAGILIDLEAGRPVSVQLVSALAEEIVADAWAGGPLRFAEADVRDLPRFVAAHSLTVARVTARVARHDPDFRTRPAEAVAAALLSDVGMLRVHPEVLAKAGPLDDEERRTVEAHCKGGATLLGPLAEGFVGLVAAASYHHERLDGTGYPDGLREQQIPPLARLLAVCDTYAALCIARPHRPARETRTALADTLLLAEQGQLDRHFAECLLQLSFYPVGSMVELADGAVGLVVATPGPRRDLNSPARPVVAVLIDGGGDPLPVPQHLDLAHAEGPSVVRTLSAAECRDLLGGAFPEWL